MPIPWDISFDRVEAGCLYFLEAITPQFFRTAEIVESGTVNEYILTINGHAGTVVTDTVGVLKLFICNSACSRYM